MTRHPRAGMRARWIPVVVQADVDGETRALLLFLALNMGDHARFSGPTRADIAAVFGVSERRIAERFQRAQNAGLLARVSGGYNGSPAVWEAVIPSAELAS